MSELIVPCLTLVVALTGLVWGADRFVYGAAGGARHFGITPMVIGLTVVSIGTSAPEIIVSINAALKGAGELAVGNALGSNLANIGLVLGITALISPLPVQHHLMKEEAPALLIITAIAGYFLFDSQLSVTEGLFLVIALIPLLWITVRFKKNHPDPEVVHEVEEIPDVPMGKAILWFVIGLAVLLISAEFTVRSATSLASYFGVSELVIGLTVVAIGTSLPELAASVVSAIKGHHDIALGNVIGSNLFNIMAVMGVGSAIAPIHLSEYVFSRDYLAMLVLTLLVFIAIAIALWRSKTKQATLPRFWGMLFLGLYAGYFVLLFNQTAA